MASIEEAFRQYLNSEEVHTAYRDLLSAVCSAFDAGWHVAQQSDKTDQAYQEAYQPFLETLKESDPPDRMLASLSCFAFIEGVQSATGRLLTAEQLCQLLAIEQEEIEKLKTY